MKCKKCGGENYAKAGFLNGGQRYRCRDCGCKFVPVKSESAASPKERKTPQKLEDYVSEMLEGETQANALDFLAWLKENKLTRKKWGESAWIYQAEDSERGRFSIKKGMWRVSVRAPYSAPEFQDFLTQENLLDIVHANMNKCRRCDHTHLCAAKVGEDKEKFIGFKKTVLGREFDDLCGVGTNFVNPDKKALECIEKIIEYEIN